MSAYPSFDVYPARIPAAERRAWVDADPMSLWCGVRCLDIDVGRYTCVMAESPVELNPDGGVHGGATAATVDHCMGIVAMTVLGPERLAVTASLTAEYLRPAYLPLTFKATVTSHGRTVLFAQVEVEDRDGVLCMRAQGTMVVRRMQPATEAGPPSPPAG